MFKGSSKWIGMLALLILGTACSTDPRYNRETQYLGAGGHIIKKPTAEMDNVSYWDGDSVSGKPSIKISLSEQRAYFYKNNQLVGISLVSTGREGFGTKAGTFKIIQKDKDHKSTLYGDYTDTAGNVIQKDIEVAKDPKPPGAVFDGAKMPYFMRIVGGTGMHAGFLPGYPASHGCIRMPAFMAEAFFNNVSTGTPVTITP
ncbi:MAG: L,D-transpeptidase family protein [Verrucomicrobiota bacterium]